MVPLVLVTNQNRGGLWGEDEDSGLESTAMGVIKELPNDMSQVAHWQHLLYEVTIKACHQLQTHVLRAHRPHDNCATALRNLYHIT